MLKSARNGVSTSEQTEAGRIGRIPVRNLWLLMLYASDLFRQCGSAKVAVEESPDDIPDLVAEILTAIVERRLIRNLSFGYRLRQSVLSRVRGRIQILTTARHQLLERGVVACQFEELTVNTPRNRLVRAALDSLSRVVRDAALARRCRTLSASLKQIGVTDPKPERAELSLEHYGRNDACDEQMVAAARLAFDLSLPTEFSGSVNLPRLDRKIEWIRRLFEKGVAGFFGVVLAPLEWRVAAGRTLKWQIDAKTTGIDRILPSMRADIVLENSRSCRRVIIDTKFNSILTQGWYRDATLRSGYVYQIYTYLKSQEDHSDSPSLTATGVLLHPSIDEALSESVVIQGHEIRFATVDLGAQPCDIRRQLLQVVDVSLEV